ncbi:MAG TPA: Uma2 family endonuclease [Pseudomonadales bacterium]
MWRRGTYLDAMLPTDVLTADELQRLWMPGKRLELIKGVLVVREPAGYRHGEVTAELAYRLTQHVKAQNLGRVLAAETGFKLTSDPDTVRAPDVAFISEDRLPKTAPAGYAELAPDLVVEVLSPDDRPGVVLAKVADWLTAGSRLVWVVDPLRWQVRVYRADGSESLLDSEGTLEGEDVVPGFTCPVREIV